MIALIRAERLILPGAFLVVGAAVGWLVAADPVLGITAAFGLAYVLVVMASLYAGLVVFVGLTFVAELPGIGDDVTFAKVAGLLLAISWIGTLSMRRNERVAFTTVHSGATYVLIMLLGWIALSQVWAEAPSEALETLFRLSLNAILFLIIFTAVRTPNQVLGVVAAFVAGASLAAVYGLLFVAPEEVGKAGRLSGSLNNPNELATVLVAGMALAMGLAAGLRRWPLARLGAFAAAALCVAGVLLTGSRGGLLALVVALVAFLAIGSRFRGRVLLAILAVVVAGVGYYTNIASPEVRERVAQVETGTGRIDLWTVGWRMVEAEPIVGVGAGNFRELSPRFMLDRPGTVESRRFLQERPKGVHNMYLQMWVELGIVGLGLFLFILGFGLYAAHAAVRTLKDADDQRMLPLAQAVFVALAAVLAADFFGSRQFNKELWFLLGLAPAMWALARAQAGAGSRRDAAAG